MFWFIIGTLAIIVIILVICETFIIRKYSNLLYAVNRGDVQIAKKLIENGFDVNYIGDIDNKRASALQIAVERCDKEMVSLLIENGADIIRDESILKIAVENKDKEMVSLLIEKGANVIKDESILKTAVKNQDKEIVSLLIERCENVNSFYDGKTLLDYAKDDEIIAILKSHGAKTKAELDEEARKTAEVKKVAEEAAKKEAAERARKAAEEAAERARIAEERERKAKEELERIKKLAEQGDAEAQYNLGMYYKNKGNTLNNIEPALKWLDKASKQEHVKASIEFLDALQILKNIRDDYKREYEEGLAKIPESLRHLVR